MTRAPGNFLEPVRLLFEMSRDDNPMLYEDLIRFKKGVKRVNRLRFLAHEGLMAQAWGAPRAQAAKSGDGVGGRSDDAAPRFAAARHTNQVFVAPPTSGGGK